MARIIKCDEIIYFKDEKVMYERVLADSKAIESGSQAEAFCEKYKEIIEIIDGQETIRLKRMREEEITKEEVKEYISPAIDIDSMSDDEFKEYINTLGKPKGESTFIDIIINTVNLYRWIAGMPWLGETQEEYDEYEGDENERY